jgi:integrase
MKTRWNQRTAHPGIFRVMVEGKQRGYIVFYRIPGLGQKSKTFKTQAEAKAFQARTRDPERASEFRKLEKGNVALADYFDSWLPTKRKLTPSTRLRYEGIGRNHIRHSRIGHLRLRDLLRDDIEDWINELQESGVGVGTIDKSYRTLRACLNDAVDAGKLLSNPAARISVPDDREREPFFLTSQEVAAVAMEVPERYRALVFFLAYTGARIGEASALRVRHLDLMHESVTVSDNAPEVGGKKVPGRTKTRKVRSIHLPQALVEELQRHLQTFGLRDGDSIDQDSYVFLGERDGQIRQNNFRARVFQPACRRAGIARLRDGHLEVPRVHDLRHTAAALAASAGFTLFEVKEMLGHSSIVTTSRYVHMFPDDKSKKAADLSEVLAESLVSVQEVALLPGNAAPA